MFHSRKAWRDRVGHSDRKSHGLRPGKAFVGTIPTIPDRDVENPDLLFPPLRHTVYLFADYARLERVAMTTLVERTLAPPGVD